MKKTVFTRVLSALLLLAALFAFCPMAMAEGETATVVPEEEKELSTTLQLEPYSYEADQIYKYKPERTKVFTVQVASGWERAHAEKIREKMLKKGYDAFVYRANGVYYTMSGKFREMRDALAYGESIHAYTNRSSAFVVNAWVPEEAIESFEDVFYSSCYVSDKNSEVETYWEKPTGAFYRAREGEVEVFTVQFSSGTSFDGSERNRSAMEAQGYPAFVYKSNLKYKIMTGMFYTKAEAEAYCATIRANTDQSDAVVRTASVPQKAVTKFQQWYKG